MELIIGGLAVAIVIVYLIVSRIWYNNWKKNMKDHDPINNPKVVLTTADEEARRNAHVFWDDEWDWKR